MLIRNAKIQWRIMTDHYIGFFRKDIGYLLCCIFPYSENVIPHEVPVFTVISIHFPVSIKLLAGMARNAFGKIGIVPHAGKTADRQIAY